MNALEKVLANIRNSLGQGLHRQPQEFIYLDRAALYEHYKATTGMDRVPASMSESMGTSAGAGILGINVGASGTRSTSFGISEPHLFESLEPMLREKYPKVENENTAVEQIRNFGWFRGSLNYIRVGPTKLKDTVVEQARTLHTLDAAGLPFYLACDEKSFSPFAPFLIREPYLYKFKFEVEALAYCPGVLGQLGEQVHPNSARSLVLIPTVILSKDDRTNQQIADWLRDLNHGSLSRNLE